MGGGMRNIYRSGRPARRASRPFRARHGAQTTRERGLRADGWYDRTGSRNGRSTTTTKG